ncbi:MAG: carbohydrate binding domain-containing protein [Planctomycetaceae bacterium]|nr:carbohydrate binding domain-containing protein [Planctomycetaceae bacterium]
MKRFALLLSVCLCSVLLTQQPVISADDVPMFPFVISAAAPDNAISAADWLVKPAGRDGLIRVKNGQFHNDNGRVLFWGTNLCFDACFPTKEDAELTAARIARMGFNVVRLHHMDARDIWGDGRGKKSKNLTDINPEQLDKLDYLIAQLKKNGVYVNLNLHVSRSLDERDGFTGKAERPKYDKGLDNFYRPFIDLQKKYAKDYLTHVNPYTKNAYINEPAVAMIEINNENSLVRQWISGGALENMPAPYSDAYRSIWNDFLKKKYKTTAALKKAWNCREVPTGDELLKNESNNFWRVNNGAAKTEFAAAKGNLSLKVLSEGNESWLPQLNGSTYTVEKDGIYTASLRIKSDSKQSVSISVSMSGSPWKTLGFSRKIETDKDWKTFTFQFIASESSASARFSFGGFPKGTYEIADVSVKPGGVIGLKKDETLESGTVPVIPRGASSFTKEAVDDFCEFIFETERKYWNEMYRYIKDDLKARQPVSGTQLNYGSTMAQADLDYCDIHAYWNHPVFPGIPWDSKNWYISNRALVNYPDSGNLTHLAPRRVAGKPYTVSEYDHPFPNQYAAEGLPMLAAFGRFQHWDGIFQFAYGSSGAAGVEKLSSYFNVNAHTTKLVHNPACYAIFCRGDAAEGKNSIVLPWNDGIEMNIFKKDLNTTNFNFRGLGYDNRSALLHPTALSVYNMQTGGGVPKIADDQKTFKSDTNELFWDASKENKGIFIFDSPNAKVFTGFVDDGDKHSVGDIDVVFGKTKLNWCTLSLVSLGGGGINTSGRVLVAITGDMQHTNMDLQRLENNRVTLLNKWGDAPILCEGIPVALTFNKAQGKVRCFPLDERGMRRSEMQVSGKTVKLSPEYKTVWYEVVVE